MLMCAPFATFAIQTQNGADDASTASLELRRLNAPTAVPTQTTIQDQGEKKQLRGSVSVESEVTSENVESVELLRGQINSKSQGQGGDKASQRRSRVANAVQRMLQIAERNKGVGQQIRTIAQAQNQEQEQIEAEMSQVKNRGQLKKFFFGPDHKNLNSIEDGLADHEAKLEQLRQLAVQLVGEDDIIALQEQIGIMEQVKVELENEVVSESKGFSLFGWLNKMLVK